MDPYHRGSCDRATHVGEHHVENGTCQLRIELLIDEDATIEEAWFDGDGCRTCEAIASILMEECEGCKLAQWVETTTEQLVASFSPVANLMGENEGSTDWNFDSLDAKCLELPLQVLQLALSRPNNCDEEDAEEGSTFGGPSLREEC